MGTDWKSACWARSLTKMATFILVASFITSIASLIAFVQLVIAAFEDEVWKGLVSLVAWPYLLYWSIVEYYDEGKWARVLTWALGSVVSTVLLVAYFYVRLPSGH